MSIRLVACQAPPEQKTGNAGVKETRSFVFIRAESQEERKLQGHAAVFGQPTEIGGWFREQIQRGAFRSTIQKDDIRALFNHNPDYVLGRNTAGTLALAEDDEGLKTTIDPPDTQFARDLAVSIERGDISQMSFAFEVLEEEWKKGEGKELDLRTIKKVKLFDVSPVTFPAYEGTDIGMRSHDAWVKSRQQEGPPAVPADGTPTTLGLRRQLLRRI